MDRADSFVQRWTGVLAIGLRQQFLMEVAALLASERVRERRRLCTDPVRFECACRETADEIRRERGEIVRVWPYPRRRSRLGSVLLGRAR